jgi:hypothetical protein
MFYNKRVDNSKIYCKFYSVLKFIAGLLGGNVFGGYGHAYGDNFGSGFNSLHTLGGQGFGGKIVIT